MNVILYTIVFSLMINPLIAQEVIPLYDGQIPNSKPVPDTEKSEIRDSILIVSNVSRPTLTVYPAPAGRANGDAIIVCPGGGYGILAAGHEGEDVAKRLNGLGFTAFVLKYRLPDSTWMENPEIGPIQDAQRAIILVKQNAARWNIHKNAVGILGFSAGGHLASTAATHFKKNYLPSKYRGRKKMDVRPDFCVLVYPVISFSDSVGHLGSRDNLLGRNASPEKIREYSNELQVTDKTPPTFLVHAKDDPVNYKNSALYADALARHGVPSEVLFFETGGHGFGLINKTSDIQWVERMAEWRKTRERRQ